MPDTGPRTVYLVQAWHWRVNDDLSETAGGDDD